MTSPYSKLFYAWQRMGSHNSAKRILPIVFDAVKPKSVVDVGCGVGTWLDVAHSLGAEATGYDGAWVKALEPVYPHIPIHETDLELPLVTGRTFDLAISMEVAEHLTWRRADGFVADLVALAPHVLFSAAVPGQGGTNHLNEQWQSFWAERFAEHGYGPRDIIRPAVKDDGAVAYWYRQNAILYSQDAPVLDYGEGLALDYVHPEHTGWRRPLGMSIYTAKAIVGAGR